MITAERTRRLAVTALAGGGLALALTLSGCASDAATGSGSTAATGPAATTAIPASTSAEPTTDAAEPTTALADLLLVQSDLPSDYEPGDDSTATTGPVLDALHTCTGTPSTTDEVVGTRTSPSFGYTNFGASSTSVRYETQTAADADAKLLSAPKAEQCFATVLLERFNSTGSKARSVSVTVRPGTNDGPTNAAGIVSLSFVQDQNREGSPTITVGLYFMTGPKVLTQLTTVGYGNAFPDDVSTELLFTLAKRTARA